MTQNNYTSKDFSLDKDIKWCSGCGDYSILKQVQTILPEIGVDKENIVFVSGIGCSSRFPYYMNVYGIHGIHGRAAAIASGIKQANQNLSVWLVSGDGDSFSIGGNHLIHLARRDFDINYLIFNNEIYGLTKGQFSPTSKLNQKTKSSPFGVKDNPFNPLKLLIGAGASFVARAMDIDVKGLRQILIESQKHKGTSFVEIYQNCVVFNDKAFDIYSNKGTKEDNCIFLEEGKPLIFGKEKDKAIILDGFNTRIVELKNTPEDKLWIHDTKDPIKALLLSNMFEDVNYPRPFGILYKNERPKENQQSQKKLDINSILKGDNYWEVK